MVAVPRLATQVLGVVAQVLPVAFPGPAAARLQDTQEPVVAAVHLQDTQEPGEPRVVFQEPAVVLPAATNPKSVPLPAGLGADCPADRLAWGVLQASAVPDHQPLANQKLSASSFQPIPNDWFLVLPTWGPETPPI